MSLYDRIAHPEKYQIRQDNTPPWLRKIIRSIPGNRWDQNMGRKRRAELAALRAAKRSANRPQSKGSSRMSTSGSIAVTAPSATNSIHSNTVSSVTSKSYVAPSLSTALSLNSIFGIPTKRTTKLSKQKRSKYASSKYAYRQALSILCPKLHLKMHQQVTTALSCNSGVQAVFGDLTQVYCFPMKDLLCQAHYKLSMDIGIAGKSNIFTASTAAVADTNQYIPNVDATYIPGGTEQAVTGNRQLPNFAVSRTVVDDYKFNQYPGLIMKYYKRTYTFMNPGTTAANLTVYEFIRTGNNGENEISPQLLWSAGFEEEGLQNYNLVYPASIGSSITKIGEVPRKSYKELSENWRHHKVTTYTLDPQQSCMHTAYLPGTYYSSRELFQDDSANLVRNKGMAIMFVLNGALAFEGGNPGAGVNQGQSNAVIGTAAAFLNYKIESEALFQGILQGQTYARMYCQENIKDGTGTELPLSLQKPQIIVPAGMERKYEDATNADRSGLGATLDNAVVS